MTELYDKFNETHYDLDLDSQVSASDLTLDEITQARLKNRFIAQLDQRAKASSPSKADQKGHSFKKWSLATAMIMFLFIGSFVTYKISPSFATSLPVLGHIISDFDGYGNPDFETYTKVIGTQVTDGDLSITLNEILLDDNQLRFAYTFESHVNPITDYNFNPADYTYNGKMINLSGATGTGQTLNEHTMVWVSTLDVHQMNLPKQFNLSIDFSSISFKASSDYYTPLEGNWTFKTHVTKAELESESHRYKVNQEVTIDGTSLSLTQMTLTPLSGTLDYKLYGADQPFGFIIMDNTGQEMRVGSSGYGTPKGLWGSLFGELLDYKEGDIHFSPASEEATAVTLTPYVQSYSKEGKEIRHFTAPLKLKHHEPLTLIQNEHNQLVVTDYLIKDHQLHVKFKAQGQSPVNQYYRLYAYDSAGHSLERNYNEAQMTEMNQEAIQTAVFNLPDDFDSALENGPIEASGLSLGTDDMADMVVYPDKAITIEIDARKASISGLK